MADVKQQMKQAATHIQSKEYDEAIALLATIDHPTADKWRERAESALAAQGRMNKTKRTTKQRGCLKWLAYGVVSLMIITGAFLAWYQWQWHSVWKYEFAAILTCIDYRCSSATIIENHMPDIQVCFADIGQATNLNTWEWYDCLEARNVPLN